MRIVVTEGVRLDRQPTDLEHLIEVARTTPYSDLPEITRLRLKLELELNHQKREAIRHAPIIERIEI